METLIVYKAVNVLHFKRGCLGTAHWGPVYTEKLDQPRYVAQSCEKCCALSAAVRTS